MNKKVAALGAAGVIALAGAGLYAGVLSTTTDGTIGAGATNLQASCTDSAVVTAQEALWYGDEQEWQFGGVSVELPADATCEDQYIDLVVYDALTGDVTRQAAARVQIIDTGATVAAVPLDDSLGAGTSSGAYKYGLVIQRFS